MREIMKRFEGDRKGWPWPGLNKLGERTIEAPGLRLERPFPGQVELHVTTKNEAGKEATKVYMGRSLSDILSRHPQLERHAGMAALKQRAAEGSWPGMDEFLKFRLPRGKIEVGPGGISVAISQGVEISKDENGVTVKVQETDEDGKVTTKEYKGESIEALKKAHPELEDKIGGFSVHVSPPSFRWWNDRERGRSRLRRPSPATPWFEERERPERGPFGVDLDVPDEALAAHLGLGKGQGALVVRVHPGSQAETLGLEVHDIIVKMDDQPVATDDKLVARLGKAAREGSPLRLEVIRRGETIKLTR